MPHDVVRAVRLVGADRNRRVGSRFDLVVFDTPPIGLASGNNLYAYVENDPLNLTDPSGLYFGWDDAVFTLGGTALGLAGQALHDVVTGQLGTAQDYAAAAIGGAVGGELLL